MRLNIKNQNGLTFISILVILIVIGFFGLLLLKIGPLYMENMKVKDSLASLKADPALTSYSKAKLRDSLDKRLEVNMVNVVSPEDITLTKKPGYVFIEIDYEATENIVGNLDVLVYFNDSIEVGDN